MSGDESYADACADCDSHARADCDSHARADCDSHARADTDADTDTYSDFRCSYVAAITTYED